jgi:hypothetical protein
MSARKKKVPREFRSLDDFQSAYFPSLVFDLNESDPSPRRLGANLAREAIAELGQLDQQPSARATSQKSRKTQKHREARN